MKISKDSSAKYYQNNKERLQKKLVKGIKVFIKKKKKTQQYGRERYKIYQKKKNKSLLSTEKNLTK